MTRLEKVSIRRPDLPKVELISAYCPHDFGIDDDSYFLRKGWNAMRLLVVKGVGIKR